MGVPGQFPDMDTLSATELHPIHEGLCVHTVVPACNHASAVPVIVLWKLGILSFPVPVLQDRVWKPQGLQERCFSDGLSGLCLEAAGGARNSPQVDYVLNTQLPSLLDYVLNTQLSSLAAASH